MNDEPPSIYVIMESSGEYSCRTVTAVGYVFSDGTAYNLCEKLNEDRDGGYYHYEETPYGGPKAE